MDTPLPFLFPLAESRRALHAAARSPDRPGGLAICWCMLKILIFFDHGKDKASGPNVRSPARGQPIARLSQNLLSAVRGIF